MLPRASPVSTVGRMERRNRRSDTRTAVAATAPPSAEVARDRLWAQDVRSSIRCAAVLLALLLLIDWGVGTLSAPRATLWAALAVLLFVVLYPTRVSAGEGWLVARGLLRTRLVRTDHLVSVRCLDGVGQRLVLRDTFGARVEVDPGSWSPIRRCGAASTRTRACPPCAPRSRAGRPRCTASRSGSTARRQ